MGFLIFLKKKIDFHPEQSLVDAWVTKLKNLDGNEDKRIRQDYVKYLERQLSREDKHLSVPYLDPPPDSSLPPLFEYIVCFVLYLFKKIGWSVLSGCLQFPGKAFQTCEDT